MICSSCSTDLPARATFCSGCGHRVEDPYVGTTVNDRYRIDARIAIGGFGSIYRGTHLINNRAVAIKVMHKELNGDPSLVARFRQEGLVLCNLRDAHTVTTYEIAETADNQLFIMMELLDGTTLHDVFSATGPMPWPRVFAIARSVCSALAEAHALGIVHRDLKPANIYLEVRHGRADFVKVLDFGIAKVLQDSAINDGVELTVMGQTVGTLEYMAPEQLMGGKSDPRTDIYTLGVVMFEMITGRRPFPEIGLELLTRQLSHKPPAVSEIIDVPMGVDQVLFRCLEQDASDRFPDVNALVRALDDVVMTESPSAHTPVPWIPFTAEQPQTEPSQTERAFPRTPGSEALTIPKLAVPYPRAVGDGRPMTAHAWRMSRVVIAGFVVIALAITIAAAITGD